MELSLLDIVNLLKRRLKYILLSTILFLSIFYIYSKFYISPTYTSAVKMYVDTDYSTTAAAINDLAYAQRVVVTYINILRTNKFFQSVSKECGLNYSSGQLSSMTTIQVVNSTEIFQISVTTSSAKDSYTIIQAIQKVAPEVIQSVKPNAEIGIVDPGVLPYGPSGPDRKRYTLVGAFLGMVLSVIAIFLIEIINDKVNSQNDLMKKYDVPVLGSIPNFSSSNWKKFLISNNIPFINKFLRVKKPVNKTNTKFIINESYKSIRANLRFVLRKEGCKKIIMNSPIPNDGKSTTSINMAISLAQTGARVLLLDCDLRRGILHQFFNLKRVPGITDILTGITNDKATIINTSIENLHLLTMGSVPPNPSELLGSVQMEELIDRLDKIYDYVIIDTPPVNAVSDVLNLIKLADGVILIVKEGVTSYTNISEAINKYKLSGANILGFIINAVSIESTNKSKYYKYVKKDSKNG